LPIESIRQVIVHRVSAAPFHEFNREFPTGGSFGRHPNVSGTVGAFVIVLLISLGIAATEH
jgi:hypothetical protein